MPKIDAWAVTGYPVDATRRLLREYIRQHALADGSLPLSLRVPLFTSANDDLALAHYVVARFWTERDIADTENVLHVEWAPSGDGPYPSFTGVVLVHEEPDPRISRLEIEGEYTPPGGILGAAFDLVIGGRMAQASLQDLVNQLARELTPDTSSETRR